MHCFPKGDTMTLFHTLIFIIILKKNCFITFLTKHHAQLMHSCTLNIILGGNTACYMYVLLSCINFVFDLFRFQVSTFETLEIRECSDSIKRQNVPLLNTGKK